MTGQPKQKRWRLRFSLRTLISLTTLICVYLGCWEITKRQGVPAAEAMYPPNTEMSCPMPFVITYAGIKTVDLDIPSVDLDIPSVDLDIPFSWGQRGDFGSGPVQRGIGNSEDNFTHPPDYLWFFGWMIEIHLARASSPSQSNQ